MFVHDVYMKKLCEKRGMDDEREVETRGDKMVREIRQRSSVVLFLRFCFVPSYSGRSS